MSFYYLWLKINKYVRGASLANSDVYPTSKVESGLAFINPAMDTCYLLWLRLSDREL